MEQPTTADAAPVQHIVLRPYAEGKGWKLFNADCREVVNAIGPIDTVLTDPPYPNNAGHFDDGIDAARELMTARIARQWLVFWTEIETPPVLLPYVAKHIWHRSNTNRPDNYEPIYHFAADGRKRASRVLSYAVIYPGLTGCHEATGHPTQKNQKLMRKLLEIAKPEGLVFDPFAGSGTTLRAAVDCGYEVVGCEVDEQWCEKAAKRMQQQVLF